MTKSVASPEELGGLASQVTTDYGHLAHQGRLAAATAEPEEVSALCALLLGALHRLPLLQQRVSPCIFRIRIMGEFWLLMNFS